MSVDLTRQELYDLVWSKPIMHLAKQFGISGVMLGRICKERNVPRPPRGYWANLQAPSSKTQRRFVKTPLPNLPEPILSHPKSSFNSMIKKEYEARDAARTDKFDSYDLNDPIKQPPPPFTESLKDFKNRIEACFPKLVAPELITTRHSIVQKLLDYDATLAIRRKHDRYAEDPRYQKEIGKLYLHWLNVLINSFESLGFDVTVRGKKHFVFHATILGHYKEFIVFINEANPTYIPRKHNDKTKSDTYFFRWDKEPYEHKRGRAYYEFETLTVDCIKEIVMDLVMKDEAEYRDSVVSGYRRLVEARKREIEYREQEIQRAAEEKRLALERLLAKREKLMSDAVANMIHADKIRELLEVMQSKAQATDKPVEGMKHWIGWATHHANTIDPRNLSLESFEAWISKFKLDH